MQSKVRPAFLHSVVYEENVLVCIVLQDSQRAWFAIVVGLQAGLNCKNTTEPNMERRGKVSIKEKTFSSLGGIQTCTCS